MAKRKLSPKEQMLFFACMQARLDDAFASVDELRKANEVLRDIAAEKGKK